MTNSRQNQYHPDYLVTPGEVIEEFLDTLGMSQAELAARTGLAKKTVNEIIKGKAPITPDTALKLERALGRPAHFWSNLERQLQEDRTRLAEKKRLEADLGWLKKVPVSTMAKHGWLKKQKTSWRSWRKCSVSLPLHLRINGKRSGESTKWPTGRLKGLRHVQRLFPHGSGKVISKHERFSASRSTGRNSWMDSKRFVL